MGRGETGCSEGNESEGNESEGNESEGNESEGNEGESINRAQHRKHPFRDAIRLTRVYEGVTYINLWC